jgi:hypothetical protein
MIEDFRSSPMLAKAVHVILVLLGGFLLYLGKDLPSDSYCRAVIINLGTSLVSVTLVFLVYRFFTPTSNDTNVKATNDSAENETDTRTTEIARKLRADQRPEPPSVLRTDKRVQK